MIRACASDVPDSELASSKHQSRPSLIPARARDVGDGTSAHLPLMSTRRQPLIVS
jgi:hypothetical protein